MLVKIAIYTAKKKLISLILAMLISTLVHWARLVCLNNFVFRVIKKNCWVQIKLNFDITIRTIEILSCPWLISASVTCERRYHELLIEQASKCSAKKRDCTGFIQWWSDSTGRSTNSRLWYVHLSVTCISDVQHSPKLCCNVCLV